MCRFYFYELIWSMYLYTVYVVKMKRFKFKIFSPQNPCPSLWSLFRPPRVGSQAALSASAQITQKGINLDILIELSNKS
jgi:hypothetical protein